jgi:PAS domain S-box-containing protein
MSAEANPSPVPAAPHDLVRSVPDALHRSLEIAGSHFNDMVIVARADHVIVDVNDRVVEVLGYGRGELLRMSVTDLRDPATLGDFDRRIEEQESSGHALFETRYRRKDGSTLPVEVSVRVFELGGARYYQGAARDIGTRKHTEEALRASEAKFRAAFHGAGLGILLVDGRGAVLEFNRTFRDMLGWSEEELQRARLPELLHGEEAALPARELQRMSEGAKDLVLGEWRFRRRDGTPAHGLVRATAVHGADGAFQYAVALVEDLAAKRSLEAQLVFADRMASMGTLAAGVAHEINNPLAFITANLEFALSEVQGHQPALAAAASALEDAREGTNRVRNIVRDLKIFSRVDAGDEDLVDVRQALRSAVNVTNNELRHRAIVQLELAPVPFVRGSGQRLGQVFVNLLINAAQAMTEGHANENRIRVACFSAPDERVVVEVADTGCGIAPENQARIFEPFFTTKPVGVGTGLGLSVCHGIVERLHGEITVESRLGQGATFRVLLPRADAPVG